MQIPRKIFQSWKTLHLDPCIQQNTERLKQLNPEYEYQIFDNKKCRNFLQKYYGQNYVNAFDNVKSGAFKCDLWRYAVLYKYGGVYIDIDMQPIKPLKNIIRETDKFLSVKDASGMPCRIYQAFIAVVPNHPIMKYALEASLYNIATRTKFPFESLSITGPITMGVAVNMFLNRFDTHQLIEFNPSPGIRFLKNYSKYTINPETNEKLFLNTVKCYRRGANNYTLLTEHYHSDPRKYKNRLCFIVICVCLLLFIVIICLYIHERKIKLSY